MKKILFLFFILMLTSCEKNLSYFTDKSKIIEGDSNIYSNKEIEDISDIEENKLRVALLVPLSGKVKNIGKAIVNTAEMSIYNNNKHDILLRVYDTEGTTFGAVNAINRAIKDGIDVVIGPLFSEETKAIKNILKNNNIIAFSLSNDEQLRNINNVFVTGSIPEQEIQTLISYMINNDFYNYIALMPNSSHGALMNKILRNTILNKDGLLIKTDYYDQNEKSMLNKINQLVNFYEVPKTIFEDYEKKKLESKILGEKAPDLVIKDEEKIYPQAIFIADGGKVAENIANLLFITQKDNKYIQLIGTSKIDGDSGIKNNPYMDKTIFIGSNPEKYQKFYDEYFYIYKQEPQKITTIVYDLFNILDTLYENNGRNYVINKKNLLSPKGFDGIDGSFRFLPNGLIERNFYILQLQDREKIIIDTNQEFLNY